MGFLRRAMVAIPIAGFGAYSIHRAFGGALPPEAMVWLLFAAAMLISVATLFAFPIAGWVGDQFARIYMPGGSDVPPPHYLLAGRYEQEAKWDLAFAEYEKILHYHPQEVPAHVARIRLAVEGYGDPPLARHCLRQSLRRLRDQSSRQMLEEYWERCGGEGAARSA